MRPRPAPADTIRRTGFPVVSPTKDLRDSKLPSHFQIGRFAGVSRRRGHGDYLQLDETPVKVIDPDLLGRTATGWLWAYARPGGPVPFDFQGGRGREGPERMLRDFRGTFQSDGYGVYESIERQRPDLRRVGCWAHARRKFHEALEDDAAWTREFIAWIARLYAVEKEAREQGLTPEARKALRGERVPEEAGWRSAVIDSLPVTARRAGLDPAKWLEDVLRRIPTATTANLHELLPGNGKPATA